MNVPSISVIIPAYNAARTILLAIDSVLIQKYKGEIEIIVIDDGSTDDTNLIVSEFTKEQKNASIRLIKKQNGGVSSARNMGMRLALHDFIAFLDSDDVWLPGKLSAQIAVFQTRNDVYFLGTSRNSESYPFNWFQLDNVFKIRQFQMLIKWWPSVPTVIFRKEIIAEVGEFNETLRHGEDSDFWLRVLSRFPIHAINQSYVLTGGGKPSYGSSGLSADLSGMHKGELHTLNAALRRNQIGLAAYYLLCSYYKLKYFRRIALVKLRRTR